ncbi:MAG: hypothetical protein ACOYT4_00850 [Nanoarchaeota archaeon]
MTILEQIYMDCQNEIKIRKLDLENFSLELKIPSNMINKYKKVFDIKHLCAPKFWSDMKFKEKLLAIPEEEFSRFPKEKVISLLESLKWNSGTFKQENGHYILNIRRKTKINDKLFQKYKEQIKIESAYIERPANLTLILPKEMFKSFVKSTEKKEASEIWKRLKLEKNLYKLPERAVPAEFEANLKNIFDYLQKPDVMLEKKENYCKIYVQEKI